jgi:hypothetical protein
MARLTARELREYLSFRSYHSLHVFNLLTCQHNSCSELHNPTPQCPLPSKPALSRPSSISLRQISLPTCTAAPSVALLSTTLNQPFAPDNSPPTSSLRNQTCPHPCHVDDASDISTLRDGPAQLASVYARQRYKHEYESAERSGRRDEEAVTLAAGPLSERVLARAGFTGSRTCDEISHQRWRWRGRGRKRVED